MKMLFSLFRALDPYILIPALLLSGIGLVTMFSFQDDAFFFGRQLIWIAAALVLMFLALIPDYRWLRTGHTLFLVYVSTIVVLVAVLFVGEITLGAQSRFDFGFFSLQPSEPAKLILIAILAKYFSKRHELIGDFRHILVSGLYALVIFLLVFVQPDLGSAIIIFFIWLGMILVAGIKPHHLALVIVAGMATFALMWQFVLLPHQQERVMTFLDPLADIQGAGYSVYQSTVAVGSGQLFGKGVGYGTQSKLQFLPEYETDFIFAAYAEEWGFVGVVFLFTLFGVLIIRLLIHALRGATNFESLFATGVAILFVSHFMVHIGVNIGLLPVTGVTVPFLSYGGTHLMTEFIALGMVMAMSRYGRIRRQASEINILEE